MSTSPLDDAPADHEVGVLGPARDALHADAQTLLDRQRAGRAMNSATDF